VGAGDGGGGMGSVTEIGAWGSVGGRGVELWFQSSSIDMESLEWQPEKNTAPQIPIDRSFGERF